MVSIDIEYKPWWLPWRRHIRSWAPSHWWEMSERQYMSVVRSLLGQTDETTYHAEMFGIPKRMVRRMDSWQRYMMNRQVRWLESGRSEVSRFFISKIGGLLAPEDGLKSMTLQQYMTADTFFDQYTDTITDAAREGNPERLRRFVAAIYLGKNEDYFTEPGDGKVLVDIDGNASRIAGVDHALVWGVYMNWVMIRNWLSRAYPLLFPEGEVQADSSPRVRQRNVWLNAFDSFVGDDVAHLDAYRKMACTDAFRIMNRKIKLSRLQNKQ